MQRENFHPKPSLYAKLSIEEIAAAKPGPEQVTFQQVYLDTNDTASKIFFDRAEKAGSKVIIFTAGSAADGNRHRAARFDFFSFGDNSYSYITWDVYAPLQALTSLPILIKDAQAALKAGVKAIILSNHGGRQLDGSPSSLEVALEIHQQAPEVFQQIEVYADGGVRYGVDVLKLLSLGVKAVGLGRPFMYANVFGAEGVKRAIDILKYMISLLMPQT
ncbi:Hydroxyacid oxidase [Lachnellula suecica]|uniref:Hydroxyacid oxidase n=1 Tax=Lachnellula suecica TaxID=602035 RepID=A0A8T9C7R2_9HELO|nr:Hydroxyacid oxidase [Lachnellula suecica]